MPIFCDFDKERCTAFTKTGYKIFYDQEHYTLEGAKFIGKRMFDRGFKEILFQALKQKGVNAKKLCYE